MEEDAFQPFESDLLLSESIAVGFDVQGKLGSIQSFPLYKPYTNGFVFSTSNSLSSMEVLPSFDDKEMEDIPLLLFSRVQIILLGGSILAMLFIELDLVLLRYTYTPEGT
jgi:hypothetical protein